jgi:hypothetical protein
MMIALRFRMLPVFTICLSAASVARAQVDWVGVPANPTTPMAFELASNWTAPTYNPVPSVGPELTPPGFDSTFFIENVNGVVALTEPRTGEDGTMALGAMAIGNNAEDGPFQMQTLLISTDVVFTGLERSGSSFPAGEYNGTLRHIRIGRGRDANQADVDAWGIVRQTAGTVRLNQHVTEITEGPVTVAPQPERAEILLSSDKDKSAGSIWEVGGTASLFVPDDLRIGDRFQAVFMPGSVFRVRGSQVGTVEVGDAFQVASDAGLWDADRPDEFGNRLRFNRGKSVTEFVLDAGGVTPISVLDNLDIGDYNNYPSTHPMAGTPEYTYGFLRIKLSEPTSAGSGAVGSGNEIVLFRADRISTDTGGNPTNTDFDNGRFFDPDHPSAVGPHQPLFDSDNEFDGPGVEYRVRADYAGAQYSWRIDYNTSVDDDELVDAVTLSNLMVTGAPGDYDGGGRGASDLSSLLAARGTAIPLGSAQNQFDLNADDAVDNLDAIEWITHPGLLDSRLGDFDLDRDVDGADLTILRTGFGSATSYTAGDADFDGDVDGADLLVWQRNVGPPNAAVGAAGAVPEPGAAALLTVGAWALAWRRRQASSQRRRAIQIAAGGPGDPSTGRGRPAW